MSSKEGVALTLKGRNKDPLTGRYPLLVEGFSRVGNLKIHHIVGVEVKGVTIAHKGIEIGEA